MNGSRLQLRGNQVRKFKLHAVVRLAVVVAVVEEVAVVLLLLLQQWPHLKVHNFQVNYAARTQKSHPRLLCWTVGCGLSELEASLTANVNRG